MFGKDGEAEKLKIEMLEKIRSGGAWFSTRSDKFIKIAYSNADDCYYARECFLKDGTLEGGAYTFGTDWFDIYFHKRNIDIYADADSFQTWDVWYDPEKGTCFKAPDDKKEQAKRVFEFCKQADGEALAGGLKPYKIDSTNFDKILELRR